MKIPLSVRACLLASGVLLCAIGCGSDDDDGNDPDGGSDGTGGMPSSGSSACLAECDKQATGGCLISTLDACRQNCGELTRLPPACYAAMNALSQCRVDSDDACAEADPDPCETEFNAIVTEC